MVTRICSLVVRIGGSLALLLGLLRYFNIGPDLVQLHMTLGILVVLARSSYVGSSDDVYDDLAGSRCGV